MTKAVIELDAVRRTCQREVLNGQGAMMAPAHVLMRTGFSPLHAGVNSCREKGS